MSNLDISLYAKIIEGLTYNRELEIYYNDFTYGIVTYGELWQLWKDKELLVECNDFLPLLENPLINGSSLKDIIEARDCGLLLM
ncbi:hypothetical protein [Veillonella parvula]|uniref:hypothetical protein n=1 Tax=Veillonella parvula TaxID=29466 RepID=UPI000EEA18C1|nr:hypothetical protein [Veillonella parvula]MDU1161173.1 hypothetical protein [Veillonella parvula]MDU1167022.1 hypothetical protein [Veillonella parvula]MDU1261718.1 hypothetical protein [Veillonella sp.]RGZ81930.1 hypothetical protein DW971_01550 [Veillonella parvula]